MRYCCRALNSRLNTWYRTRSTVDLACASRRPTIQPATPGSSQPATSQPASHQPATSHLPWCHALLVIYSGQMGYCNRRMRRPHCALMATVVLMVLVFMRTRPTVAERGKQAGLRQSYPIPRSLAAQHRCQLPQRLALLLVPGDVRWASAAAFFRSKALIATILTLHFEEAMWIVSYPKSGQTWVRFLLN